MSIDWSNFSVPGSDTESTLQVALLPALGGVSGGRVVSTPLRSRSQHRSMAAAELALRRLASRANTSLGHDFRSQPNSFSRMKWIKDLRNSGAATALDLRDIEDFQPADVIALRNALATHTQIERVYLPSVQNTFLRTRLILEITEASKLNQNLMSVVVPDPVNNTELQCTLQDNQRRRENRTSTREARRVHTKEAKRVGEQNEETTCFLHWENSMRLATTQAAREQWTLLMQAETYDAKVSLFNFQTRITFTHRKKMLEANELTLRIENDHHFVVEYYSLRQRLVIVFEESVRKGIDAERMFERDGISADRTQEGIMTSIRVDARFQNDRRERFGLEDEEVIARRQLFIFDGVFWMRMRMRYRWSRGERAALAPAMRTKPPIFSTPHSAFLDVVGAAAAVMLPDRGNQTSLSNMRKRKTQDLQEFAVLGMAERLERDRVAKTWDKLTQPLYSYAVMLSSFAKSYNHHLVTYKRALTQCRRTLQVDPSYKFKQFRMHCLGGSSTFLCEGMKIDLQADGDHRDHVKEQWQLGKDQINSVTARLIDFNSQHKAFVKTLMEIASSRKHDPEMYRFDAIPFHKLQLASVDEFIERKLFVKTVRIDIQALKKCPFENVPRLFQEPPNAYDADSYSIVIPSQVTWWNSSGEISHMGGCVVFDKSMSVVVSFPSPVHIDNCIDMLRTIRYYSSDKSDAVYCRCLKTKFAFSPDAYSEYSSVAWEDGVRIDSTLTVVRWASYVTASKPQPFSINEYTPAHESELYGHAVVARSPVVEREAGYCGILRPNSDLSNGLCSTFSGFFIKFETGYTLEDQILFLVDNDWDLFWDRQSHQELRYKDETVAIVSQGYMWRPSWTSQQQTKMCESITDEISIEFVKPVTSTSLCEAILARLGVCNRSPSPTPGRREISVKLMDSLGNAGGDIAKLDVKRVCLPAELKMDPHPRIFYFPKAPDKMKKHFVFGLQFGRSASIFASDTSNFSGGRLSCVLTESNKTDFVYLMTSDEISVHGKLNNEIHYDGTVFARIVKGGHCSGNYVDVQNMEPKEKELVIEFFTDGAATITAASALLKQMSFCSLFVSQTSSPVSLEVELISGTALTKTDEDGMEIRSVSPGETITGHRTACVLSITIAEAKLSTHHDKNMMTAVTSGFQSLGISAEDWEPHDGAVTIMCEVIEGPEDTDSFFPFNAECGFDVLPMEREKENKTPLSPGSNATTFSFKTYAHYGKPRRDVIRNADSTFLRDVQERDAVFGIVPHCVLGVSSYVRLAKYGHTIANVNTTGPFTIISMSSASEVPAVLEAIGIAFVTDTLTAKNKIVRVRVVDAVGEQQLVVGVTREPMQTCWPFLDLLLRQLVYRLHSPSPRRLQLFPLGCTNLASHVSPDALKVWGAPPSSPTPFAILSSAVFRFVIETPETGDRLEFLDSPDPDGETFIQLTLNLDNYTKVPTDSLSVTQCFSLRAGKVSWGGHVVAHIVVDASCHELTITVKDIVPGADSMWSNSRVLQLISMIAFRTTGNKRGNRVVSAHAMVDNRPFRSAINVSVEGTCFDIKSRHGEGILGIMWKTVLELEHPLSVGEKITINTDGTDLERGMMEVSVVPESGTLAFEPDEDVQINDDVIYVCLIPVAIVETHTKQCMRFVFKKSHEMDSYRLKTILRQILFSANGNIHRFVSLSRPITATESRNSRKGSASRDPAPPVIAEETETVASAFVTKHGGDATKTLYISITLEDINDRAEGTQMICYAERPDSGSKKRDSTHSTGRLSSDGSVSSRAGSARRSVSAAAKKVSAIGRATRPSKIQ